MVAPASCVFAPELTSEVNMKHKPKDMAVYRTALETSAEMAEAIKALLVQMPVVTNWSGSPILALRCRVGLLPLIKTSTAGVKNAAAIVTALTEIEKEWEAAQLGGEQAEVYAASNAVRGGWGVHYRQRWLHVLNLADRLRQAWALVEKATPSALDEAKDLIAGKPTLAERVASLEARLDALEGKA